jgi:hypothetical protein
MNHARWSALGAVVFALCVGLWAGPANAENRRSFGLGLILGEPTGLSVKGFVHNDHAIQAHMSWDFTDEGFALLVDYVFHLQLLSKAAVWLDFTVGAGGKLVVRDDDDDRRKDDDGDIALGARIPLGLSLRLKKVPLEIFIEVAPGIRLVPETDPDIDGGLGLRWFF